MTLRGIVTSSVCAGLLGVIALPACAQTAGVGEVVMALDGDGARRRDVFYTDQQQIHCVAKAMFGRDDVTIRGVFHRVREYSFAEKEYRDVDSYSAGIDFHPAKTPKQKLPSIIDFSYARVDSSGTANDKIPYIAGDYFCEIELDGEVVKSVPFSIDFPDCPQTNIATGATCLGYYKEGTDCGKYGVKSKDPARCKCGAKGGWECDPD